MFKPSMEKDWYNLNGKKDIAVVTDAIKAMLNIIHLGMV